MADIATSMRPGRDVVEQAVEGQRAPARPRRRAPARRPPAGRARSRRSCGRPARTSSPVRTTRRCRRAACRWPRRSAGSRSCRCCVERRPRRRSRRARRSPPARCWPTARCRPAGAGEGRAGRSGQDGGAPGGPHARTSSCRTRRAARDAAQPARSSPARRLHWYIASSAARMSRSTDTTLRPGRCARADAGPDADRRPVELDGRGQAGDERVEPQLQRGRGRPSPSQQQGELVTAEAGGDLAGARARPRRRVRHLAAAARRRPRGRACRSPP